MVVTAAKTRKKQELGGRSARRSEGGEEHSHYEAFADGLQSKADDAFAQWVRGLDGDELASVLRAAGVGEGDISVWWKLPEERRAKLLRGEGHGHSDVGLEDDVASTASVACEEDVEEDWSEILMDELGLTEEQATKAALWDENRMDREVHEHEQRVLEAVMCRLTSAASPRIAAVAMAFALSVPVVRVTTFVEGRRVLRECRTQMQAAAALLTSRQNLSKEVRKALRFLGSKQNMHSKRPHEVESFRTAQRRNHWRRRVFSRSCEHGRGAW